MNRLLGWLARLFDDGSVLLTARGPYSGNGQPYRDAEGNAYVTVECIPHRVRGNDGLWTRVRDGGRGGWHESGYYRREVPD